MFVDFPARKWCLASRISAGLIPFWTSFLSQNHAENGAQRKVYDFMAFHSKPRFNRGWENVILNLVKVFNQLTHIIPHHPKIQTPTAGALHGFTLRRGAQRCQWSSPPRSPWRKPETSQSSTPPVITIFHFSGLMSFSRPSQFMVKMAAFTTGLSSCLTSNVIPHPRSSVLVTPCTSEETEFLKVRRRWCASAKPAWLRLPMEEKSSCMCQLIYIYMIYHYKRLGQVGFWG